MKKRDRWSSRTIFLFAAVGSAVGLGNIWRFPYMTYKFGGGAFLIPYLLALFVIGIPLLMLEFAIGQKFQKGAIGAFKAIHPKLRGLGLGAILVGFFIVMYYAVVLAWALFYLVKSFSAKLPWSENPESYFLNSVLGVSDGIGNLGGLNWTLLIALAVVWIGMFFIVRKGVKSVGKVVIISMPLPVILLVILFVRGITLPGAFTGIASYLKPDFSALLDVQIWVAAVAQIFFTLSVAFGIMIAYASYNKRSQSIRGDSYITSLADATISLFAGFVVFSILGYMATASGVGVDEVATSGPGLAFVVFPQALSLMPFASFFAVLFFLVLLSLGLDSAFSMVEAVNTVISDKYERISKGKIAGAVCALGFIFGIIFVTGAGLYFLDIVDHFVTSYGLVLVGLVESIAIGWIYGAKNLRKFINETSGFKMGAWWDYAIKFVIPVALIILLVFQFVRDVSVPYEGYPGWALAIGWGVVLIPIIIGTIFSFKARKS